MTPEATKKFERIRALIVRRLQTAGSEGISASDFAPMIHAEFEESSPNACRSLLIRMANDGKIFRKAVGMDKGGLQSHYFLTAEFCNAYSKNLLSSHTLGQSVIKAQPTIPTFGIVEHREVSERDFGPGIKVKEGVKVQVLTPYLGDYRIKVDPNHTGSFTKEWQERRAQA